MHRIPAFAPLVVLALLAAAPAGAQLPETSPAHSLIDARCILCHGERRILQADPSALPDIVERMTAKDPALFRDADAQAITGALSRLLADPGIAAGREAWTSSVAAGREAFNDPSLGTNGKSCASCHRPEDLRGTAARHPGFDRELERLVSLQERIRRMIVGRLGGPELPLGDPRMVALEAYLASLE